MGALKAVAPAAALMFGAMAAAPAAHADTYVLQEGDMYNYRQLRLSGSNFTTVTVKAAPVLFDGYIKGTPNEPFENLVAFCVDVYHSIGLQDYNPDLTYTDDIDLTHNSHWDPSKQRILTFEEKVHIGKLVNYGTEIWYSMANGNARYNELAAVQGAIWKVVSRLTVTAVNNGTQNTAIQNRVNALANANTYDTAFIYAEDDVRARIKLLTPFKDGRYPKKYPHRELTQAFAIAGPVPEPATWIMMIGGFAVAGGMLRRSRAQAATAKVLH